VRCCGQADDECRSLAPYVVVTQNLATVLLHDSVADAETKAGTFANFLRGEEGIEDLVGMRDAVTVVGERNFHRISGLGGHDLDARGATDLAHRVVGVVQDVEEDLLELVGVTDDIGQVFIEMLDDFDSVAVEIVGAELDGPAQDQIQLQGVSLRRHLPRETQQVLNDLLGALGLLENHPQIFAGTFREVGIFEEQVGESQDRGEGIVHLMRYAGDQVANRSHLLGVYQFVAEDGGVGDVGEDDDNAGHESLLVAHRTEVGGEFSGATASAHNFKFKIVDLLPVQGVLHGLRQGDAKSGGRQLE